MTLGPEDSQRPPSPKMEPSKVPNEGKGPDSPWAQVLVRRFPMFVSKFAYLYLSFIFTVTEIVVDSCKERNEEGKNWPLAF